jgi:predicted ATPase/DNA-binding CsgD family transcriptional regulator
VSEVYDAPPELSSFVGRAEELAQLSPEIRPGRLLTLLGPGGCGKTRLALRLAHHHPTPAHWLPLDALSADPLVDRVAEALGVTVPVGTEATAALLRELRGRELLLVLDNCEHLVGPVAELVGAVLGGCPKVALLATSRRALGVPGERAWMVPPLALPDALDLFLERAGIVADGAAGGETAADPTADPVARAEARAGARRVCDRLDRLPLAIELAAAWAGTLTPRQIADSLHDPYALLDGGAATAPFRQRTLAESMRWSHDLLGDDERLLFRRLAVFEPGFDATAVRAVAALGGPGELPLLKALRGLVAASLLVADTTGPVARYRMLATVRAYAQARLDESGETIAARDAHLHLQLAALAELAPLLDTDKDTWRSHVSVAYPNLRAAIEWGLSLPDPTAGRRLATDLAWLWHLGTHGPEGLTLLPRAAALGTADRTVLQAECLAALALVADTVAPGGAGHEAARRARELADEVGAPAAGRLARSLTAVGLLTLDPAEARAEAIRARDEAAAAGDHFVADASAALVGLLDVMADDHVAAIETLTPVAPALLARGDRGVASSALSWLATATARTGDLASATALAERAVDAAAPLRESHRAGLARAALAEIHALRGNLAAATAALAPLDSLSSAREDDPVFVPGLEWAHATVCMAAHRPAEALTWLARELRWIPAPPTTATDAGEGGGLPIHPLSRLLRVRALRWSGETEAARKELPGLLEAAAGLPSVLAGALGEQALLVGDDEPDRRLALQHEALRLRSEHGLTLGCVDSLEAIAETLSQRGESATAALLSGAAAAARDRFDYRGRLEQPPSTDESPTPDQAAAPDRAAALDEGFAKGRGMGLEEAVAFARRARGPRGRPASGWASLTPTERSVVELAARGLTNPDIAARLYVSRGTVKTHLAHVYAKLGVSNRTDLARLTAGRDRPDR